MAAAAAAAVGDVGDDRQKIRKALLQVDNFKRANKELRELLTEVVERMRGLEAESRAVKKEHEMMAGKTEALNSRIKELEVEKKATASKTRVFSERFYATHQALENATARVATLTTTFDDEVARARSAIAAEVAELRTARAGAEKRLAASEARCRELSPVIATQKGALDTASAAAALSASEHAAALHALEAAAGQMRSDLDERDKRTQQAERGAAEWRALIEGKDLTISASAAELATLRATLTQYEAERAATEATGARFRALSTSQCDAVKELRCVMRSLHVQNVDLRTKLRALRAEALPPPCLSEDDINEQARAVLCALSRSPSPTRA